MTNVANNSHSEYPRYIRAVVDPCDPAKLAVKWRELLRPE